jgi:hypothetical protein
MAFTSEAREILQTGNSNNVTATQTAAPMSKRRIQGSDRIS